MVSSDGIAITADAGSVVKIIPVLNLVHVTTVPDSLGFFHGHIGYLQAHGFHVQAVSSPGALADQFRAREQIPVHTIPMARSVSPAHDGVALWRLWRLFRALKPDIVHSHTPKAGLLGTLAARLASVPIVFLSVFGLPQMTRTGLTRRILDVTSWLACSAAHRVWCDSFSMRDYLSQSRLCPIDKIVVFGQGSVNGVDAVHTFSPELYGKASRLEIRTRYGIPPSALVIGYVGRIVRDKGIGELVSAWRILREQYNCLHLLLLGSFEAKDPLSADDENLLDTDARIHLTGHLSDVAPYYGAMDIFVMPSYREGFGVTNIEAAAMELPVVSSRIPGCVDSVQDGLTGTLVPPRDAVALRSAIEMYLNNPELMRQHGQAGRVRVLRDFRPEVIRESLAQEYLRLWQTR
jgi:glycosyltransferase involved in cell wall biosynthesis